MFRIRRRDSGIELLDRIALFDLSPRDELRAIARVMSLAEVPPGAVVCEEDQFGEEVFIVADGEATVTIAGVEVGRLGPGGFFGEMALLEYEHRMATVTAVTPMTLLVFGRRGFTTLLYAAPSLVRAMLVGTSSRLRSVERHLASRG